MKLIERPLILAIVGIFSSSADAGYSSNKFEVLAILDGNNRGTLVSLVI